nr:hypothetical protein CcurKRNrm2_p023 [Cryptomonas curvata]
MPKNFPRKQKNILKKNSNLELSKMALTTRENRYLKEEFIFTPYISLYENFIYSISLPTLKYFCGEYIYKPNGDLKNFI